ncbi:MAG: 3-dehydroquinate synthase [Bacteroidota bacterium]
MHDESSHRQTVTVDLGDRSYPIVIGEGILSSLTAMVRERLSSTEGVVISDRTVAELYMPAVRRALRNTAISITSIIIPPGEQQKNINRVNTIISVMLRKRLSRTAAVFALGGGVVGDLAGFVAAIYQRGIDFIQIPTTLLAQVDSSVGGKVGVNHPLGKNMIGAFHQPRFVLADSTVLVTLPPREFICGLGEVIKYGIIADDEFFQYLEKHLDEIVSLDPEVVMHTIARCCSLKADIVRNDEREKAVSGGRAVLNFGHTIGHAIEAAVGYRGIKHGEAVLLGMLVESRMANLLGILDEGEYKRIASLINRLALPNILPSLSNGKLVAFMSHDKKVKEKKIHFIIPTKIGSVQIVGDVPQRVVKQSLDDLKNFFRYGKKK